MSLTTQQITQLNNLTAQFATGYADFCLRATKGLNTKNNIQCYFSMMSIIRVLNNNVASADESLVTFPIGDSNSGVLNYTAITCLISKLTELISSTTGTVPATFPPTHLLWSAGDANVVISGSNNINWR